MVSAGDFKNGLTVEIEGNIYQILDFQHVKPGKGAAFVRTKLKNIINGGVVEKTFRPTEKFETAHIDRKDMQYLYTDGDLYNFMDMETYDQLAVNADVVGDSLKFVKENETVKVISHQGNVFAIEPPITVEAASYRDRTWCEGRYSNRCYKAGYRRNWSTDHGSAVCKSGRCSEDRHTYRRIFVQSIMRSVYRDRFI